MYQKRLIYQIRYIKNRADSNGRFHTGGEAMPYRFIFSYSLRRWMHRREAARDLFPFAALSADTIAARSASAFTEASDPGITSLPPEATAPSREAGRCR